MRVGTKSVLFGAHAFWLHPLYLARAWVSLYGIPWDPRLWVAFAVHDLGYLGKPNMDGPEGESHVELGASIMRWLFGNRWGDFCALHSRYWARKRGLPISALCLSDKLAFAITPAWLYLPMTRATGELHEYMAVSRTRQAGDEGFTNSEETLVSSRDPRLWFEGITSYTRRWVERHKDSTQLLVPVRREVVKWRTLHSAD